MMRLTPLIAAALLGAAGYAHACERGLTPTRLVYSGASSIAAASAFVAGALVQSGTNVAKGVAVEAVLPDDWGVFGDPDIHAGFKPSASPKRAVVTIGDGCQATLPPILADARTGTFTVSLRVVSAPQVTLDVPIRVIDPTTAFMQPFSPARLLAAGEWVSIESPEVVWIEQNAQGPRPGVPVTFTAPADGPSVLFDNAARSITVPTDAFGVARARALVGPQAGTFSIHASIETRGVDLGPFTVGVTAVASIDARPTPAYGTAGASIRVSFPGFPCGGPAAPNLTLPHGVDVHVDGLALPASAGIFAPCTAGQPQELVLGVDLPDLTFGTHEVTAASIGANGVPASAVVSTRISVQPTHSIATASGRGTMRLAFVTPSSAGFGTCTNAAFTPVRADADGVPALPDASLPYGLLRMQLEGCSVFNDFGVAPGPVIKRFLVALDEEPAPGTIAWSYGPGADGVARWTALATAIEGNQVVFDLTFTNPFGSGRPQADALVTLGAPRYSAIPGTFQDLWWAGPGENGWGLSITQHGSTLFNALFVYDAQGEPRWLVMPGGTWNAARTAYTGALYRPTGQPIATHTASALRVGAPVGTATIAFTSYDTGSLTYTIDGVPGVKSIRRQLFGAPAPLLRPHADDLWWGGAAQSGWGLAVAQQHETVFAVLFTYDAQGGTTWLVAPSGTRAGFGYQSPLYRTKAAPWLGVPYDPAAFVATRVGDAALGIGPANAGSMTLTVSDATISKNLERQPF